MASRRLLAFLAVTLPLTSLAAAAPSDVEGLLKDRHFFAATEQATQLIEQGALTGSSLARAYLLRGRALQERWRSREALEDFLRARELAPKSPEVAYWLGYAYARTRQNRDMALTLLREASRGGVAAADYEIGLLYGESLDRNGVAAVERAASRGVTRANTALARMFMLGRGKAQNPAEAVRLFRRAAQRGDAEAQHQLAQAYRDGYGVEKDLAASRSWHEKALAQGHAGAHLVEGSLLEGTDDVRGVQYHYWLAAQGGLPAGMVNTGLAHLRGRGVRQDWSQAAKWLSHAQGVPMADFYLGGMALYGLGMERNDQIAFEALQRASEVMIDAKALLAAFYQGGIGVVRDTIRAQRLLDEVLTVKDAAAMGVAATLLATSERSDVRQPDFAVRLAEKSLELEPDADRSGVLAAAYAAAGDFERAIQAQQRALESAPVEARTDREARLARYQSRVLWIEPFQPKQLSMPDAEPRRRSVATFIGEVIQVAPAASGRRAPGYEVGTDASFALRVVVEKVESGSLPHFMQDVALFYIQNPSQLFGGSPQAIPALSMPVGPQRFVLTEIEGSDWTFDLSMMAPDSKVPSLGSDS